MPYPTHHLNNRCAQLSAALDELLSFPGPAVLGADTNLREKEVRVWGFMCVHMWVV